MGVILEGAKIQWIGWWRCYNQLFRKRDWNGVGCAHPVLVPFCYSFCHSFLPFPSSHPSILILWYPQVSWATTVCVCDGHWWMSLMMSWGIFALILFQTYNSFCSCQTHNTFHKFSKFTNLFEYTLDIDRNSNVFLLWAITISTSCYKTSTFQSCQNFLLYQTLHFLLMITKKQQSHSK
jgi:hypothetical protein